MRMVSLSRERSFSIGSESRLGSWRDCWNGGTDVSDFEWDTDPDHDNYFTEVDAVDLENKKEAGGNAGLFFALCQHEFSLGGRGFRRVVSFRGIKHTWPGWMVGDTQY